MDPDPSHDDNILSQNGYTYAENNPVMLVDPNGYSPFTALLKLLAKIFSRSTSRTTAKNLLEKLAMKEVKSNPLKGAKQVVPSSKMKDKCWPGKKGWEKCNEWIKLVRVEL